MNRLVPPTQCALGLEGKGSASFSADDHKPLVHIWVVGVPSAMQRLRPTRRHPRSSALQARSDIRRIVAAAGGLNPNSAACFRSSKRGDITELE
jgi:hypothetical protein